MLLAEVNNPSGLRLTKSDTDGIFLHFDAGEKQIGIRIDNPDLIGSSVATVWAEKQFALLKQQPPAECKDISAIAASLKEEIFKEIAKNRLLADRHDTLASINADLLTACEYTELLLSKGIGQNTHALALIEVAIAKAYPKQSVEGKRE